MKAFAERLLQWFDAHGRHDLPWQHPRTPYRVWLSEIMLQQTQVQTVIPYFERFLARFPSVASLAIADEGDVLALWSGLGYYSRARNLHATARDCATHHGGELPKTMEDLIALPGIGRSTAAAILSQAHGQAHAILDGNVKRVLARQLGISEWPGKPTVERALWSNAERRLPLTGSASLRMPDYTQAVMDFGATLCTPRKPRCGDCPFAVDCLAHQSGQVASIPARKPKKAIPTRQTHMLVVRNSAGAVLLEHRQSAGVWKGLWSLPEAADDDELALARARLGAEPQKTLPEFTHVFSHYRLRIRPSLHTAHPRFVHDGGALRWASLDQLDAIGLPSPVRKLLESLV